MKLLAIDGNSIINRAFYGVRLLSAKDGLHTNAVFGFINILNKLIQNENPDGVAVAFDIKKPTFRHKKYADYKAGRKPMPEELKEQFPVLKEWLALMGYTCVECEGYEADDILGTLAYTAEQDDNTCVIATGDRDSLQLVSEHTRVLLSVTKNGQADITDFTPQKLNEVYSLSPEQMTELKALMGDSSDNLPGVAGIGQKTATDLIHKFGSIDYIYQNIDTIDVTENVRNKLRNGKDGAFLSRELGTICKTAPIDTVFENYRTKPRDEAKLAALMTRLEFYSLMSKMGIKPLVVKTSDSLPASTFTVCDFDELGTTDKVDIFGLCAVCGKKVSKITEEQLKALLENGEISKRIYGYKDTLKKYAVNAVCFDLLLAAYLCNPSEKEYSLSRLAAEYSASAECKTQDEDIKNAALFSACCDALTAELKKTGQESLLFDIELPLARVLGEMEDYGFLIDSDGLKKMGEELSLETEALCKQIYELADEEFNVNSPKQLGVILFEKLGLPVKKKTKSGYSTSAEVLEELKGFPIVELILKYRRLAKLKSTYCDGLLAAVKQDGRIHTTFNQTETRTGRISSLEPNLQNIPVRTEEGKKLREFFVAPKGFVLCDADYSQIELRVLASIADDKNMISAFESGVDIHTSTASEVFGIPIDMVAPIMRSRAKAVNFGIVYGIGAFSLAKDIGVSNKEAKNYIEGYLNTYKGVSAYMESVIENAKKDGFVTTAFGRRRYLPELREKNAMLRAFGERVARNAPIQGTAADIIKIAMIKVSDRLKSVPDARLILQVHDELIVECKEADREKVCDILTEEMENAVKLKVKLSVDAHSGENWLIAKG